MNTKKQLTIACLTSALIFMLSSPLAFSEDHSMSFFVTSIGIGGGANLGGLKEADAHCEKLATQAAQAFFTAFPQIEMPKPA